MPGLNFDSFEQETEHHEGAYGTDRAPTYQARYAAEFPRRYIRRFLNWIRGGSQETRVRRVRKARPAVARKRVPARRKRAGTKRRARGTIH